MKLQNKLTGEVKDVVAGFDVTGIYVCVDNHDGNPYKKTYRSLTELNEEWEDYEEPKKYWRITDLGEIKSIRLDQHHQNIEKCKQIGNYFETKEEAEKAVEKLKAWKRLKKAGFRFEGYSDMDRSSAGHFDIYAYVDTNNNLIEDAQPKLVKDLDLLFGGEE